MRPFQAIEAQYAALRAIQGAYAGDVVARLIATLVVVAQLFPATLWLREEGGAVQATALAAITVASGLYLDGRREELAAKYWNQRWIPNIKQRLVMTAWGCVLLFGVTLSARFSILGALGLFVVLGSFPLRALVNRLAA